MKDPNRTFNNENLPPVEDNIVPRKEGQTDEEYRNIIFGGVEEQEGIKDDKDKLNLEILMCQFTRALSGVAEACNYGAKKYNEAAEECNWRKVPNPKSRYRKALLRHLFSWLSGIKIDEESGVRHLSSIIWNALVLLDFEIEESYPTQTY